MFDVPGSEIKGVHITEECVMGVGSPIYITRSSTASTSTDPPPESTNNTEEEENRKYRVKQ